jgi:MFS family permease
VPLVLVGMNVAYAASAYPIGRISDGLPRARLLAAGALVLGASHLALAAASHVSVLALGVLLFGLHMGMTQGLLAALVADRAPAHARGTAFGVFHLANGAALVIGGATAGLAWEWISPAATFGMGASLALASAAAAHGVGRGGGVTGGSR